MKKELIPSKCASNLFFYCCIFLQLAYSFLSVKIAVFWYVMPYSMVDGYWHSGRTCCLHLQGRRVFSILSYLEDR